MKCKASINFILKEIKKAFVIVAHPDDETLWCGGLILLNPQIKWFVATMCRKNDTDRSPKFFRVLKEFNADGVMGDIDDGPEQKPLDIGLLQNEILSLLGQNKCDLVITHSTKGEYTKHLRHEETAQAVLNLCRTDKLLCKKLWSFAYEDGGKKYLPRPVNNADIYIELPKEICKKKYDIITKIYGFEKFSFEAMTAPKTEAFYQLR